MRQILFWVLLVYLEVNWFGVAAARLLWPAAIIGLGALVARRSILASRPSFIAAHIALLVTMVSSVIHSGSWLLLADFAVLGALVTLELAHRKPALLLMIALEHTVAIVVNPWSAVRLMNHTEIPAVGAVALLRIFTIIIVIAIFVRQVLVPRFTPVPVPAPEPAKASRPLTVAEWEARNPSK
ncbi:MAG: hypothetical protein ACRD3J_30360 [Thermoanaerobaculia bacterium]